MNREFRAHPLMILKFIKPFLFVLVIPVIKGIIQYITEKKITGVFNLEILAFSAILLIAFLQLKCFRLKFRDKKIELSKGLFFRRTAVIEIERISSAVSITGPADIIFHSVTFRLNTEAGRRGKPDFEFILYKNDAASVEKLIYCSEKRNAVKFSLRRLASAAALGSSAVTGLIIAVPVINRMGDLLGIALSEMLFNEINHTAQNINTYFPPIFNIITLIFLIGYLFSFIYTLAGTLNFRLFAGKSHIELRYGLIFRHKTLFDRRSVNDICIEQTPLMRLFHRFSMRAAVGGFGNEKGEKALLVPVAGYREIREKLNMGFDFLDSDGTVLRAARSNKMFMRFMRIPINWALCITAVSVVSFFMFPVFDRLIVFISTLALVVTVYYASLRNYNYHFDILRLGSSITARGSIGTVTRELHCPKEKIGVIKIYQNPYDKKDKTCRVKVTIRSEISDSVKVRHLNIDSVIENIEKCF